MKNRIRELREARGWSLDTLAERSGVSLEQISRIERGSNTKVATLEKITAALSVDFQIIFQNDSELSPSGAEIIRLAKELPESAQKQAIQILRALFPPDRAA